MAQERNAGSIGLRPGMSVDIIISLDMLREKADVRGSIIYDMEEGGRIILSQTTPAMTGSQLGKEMDITFLRRGPDGPTRLGTAAKLAQIIPAYRLNPTNTVPAVLMLARPRQGLKKYNLRMFHRVSPDSRSGIRCRLGSRQSPIINISIGGICVTHPADNSLRTGKVVSARIEIDGTEFAVDARIVRTWSTPELRKNKLEYVSAEFLNTDRTLNSALSGKVLEIERERLSRRME